MTEPKREEVSGCGECPWFEPAREYCRRTEQDCGEHWGFGHTTAPDWCPLRQGPMLVVLKVAP